MLASECCELCMVPGLAMLPPGQKGGQEPISDKVVLPPPPPLYHMHSHHVPYLLQEGRSEEAATWNMGSDEEGKNRYPHRRKLYLFSPLGGFF